VLPWGFEPQSSA